MSIIPVTVWLPRAPVLLVPAGLLLWGWQTQQVTFAVLMALLLESARLHLWKLELDNRDFNRITDFTSLVMVLTIVYMFYNYGSPGIFEILSSLPLVLFPMILAQQYSTRGNLNMSSLFISMRKLSDIDPWFTDNRIDISIPYFIICMIAASEGNRLPGIYFSLVCLLTAWLLWGIRSRRYHPMVWFMMLAIATGSAFAGQHGLRYLQGQLEARYIDFFNRFHSARRNEHRQTTAIGSIGTLKFSDRIVLRIEPEQPLQQLLYLAEASYNYYAYGTWTNIDQKSLVIDPELNGTSWLLSRPDNGDNRAAITAYFDDDEAILPVPQGTTGIHSLAAFQLERLNTDAIRVELKPGWNRWNVHYHDTIVTHSRPVHADLHIGQTYEKELKQLASDLGLYNLAPTQAVSMVENFFNENFRYSLTRKQRYPRGKYLGKFLFEDRKGHCEYFATATALLLRAAGIPTRYVVGYGVDEYSDFENRYVARARHAHSWVMAWIDERWIRIDTTPAVWADLESENQSSLQFISDFWSWLRLRSDELGDSEFTGNLDFTWIIAGLFLVLVLSIYSRKRSQLRSTRPGDSRTEAKAQGMDSPLYECIRRIEALGYTRKPGETLYSWFKRLSEEFPELTDTGIVELHNDYRFNPSTPVTAIDISAVAQRIPPLFPSQGH